MAASATTKPAGSAAAEPEAGGVFGRLSELAWQALPAIGSAIGFAGFVAVIGAAIEWIRFDAAALPATQAVLAVPRAELVLVGALSLGVYAGTAVLAVLLLYLIDNNGNATVATVRGIVAVGVVEMVATLCFIDAGPWWAAALLVAWLLTIGFVAADVAGEAMRNLRCRTKLTYAAAKLVEARDKLSTAQVALDGAREIEGKFPAAESAAKAREQAQVVVLSAQREWQRAIGVWDAAAAVVAVGLPKEAADALATARRKAQGYRDAPPAGDLLEAELKQAAGGTGHVFRAVAARLRMQVSAVAQKFEKAPKLVEAVDDHVITVTVVTGAVFLAAIVTGIVLVAIKDLFSWFAIVLAVVVLLTTMNVFAARATEKFAWYGISVFFSVLMFGATLTIARTLDEPKAQPIALLRKGTDVGTCGVYVAQTSERVYIGRRATGSRPGLVFWVPTNDVDLVSVGQSERVDVSFKSQAEAMLVRLYKDREQAAAPTLKNPTVTEVETDSTGKQTTKTREELPIRSSPVASTSASEAKPCP